MKILLIAWIVGAILAIKIWNKNAKGGNTDTSEFFIDIVKKVKETFK